MRLPYMSTCPVHLQIHTRAMNCERDIRFELLARLCPNSTGADIRSVCTEAGMYAIRAHRKTVTEKDFLEAVNKVGLLGRVGRHGHAHTSMFLHNCRPSCSASIAGCRQV